MVNVGNAFLVFYAVFWAGVLGVLGRYRLFDTSDLSIGSSWPRIGYRILAGVFFMNILPLAWAAALYQWVLPLKRDDGLGIFVAGLAALSVFGFHRIMHGFIATSDRYHHYYTNQEWEILICKWRDK